MGAILWAADPVSRWKNAWLFRYGLARFILP